MMSNNKILTVSYGTFSCTLEGFEDSFDTMKAIAEYFRDLAADDRYFGAEPPQPDAEMLARIAEREIARRVEARAGEHGIHLRAGTAAALPVSPPQEPVASQPATAPVSSSDVDPQTAPQHAAAAPAEAATPRPDEAQTAAVTEEPAAASADISAETIGTVGAPLSDDRHVSAALSLPMHAGLAQPEAETGPGASAHVYEPHEEGDEEGDADDETIADFFARSAEPEIPVAEEVHTPARRLEPNSIADKLQRIRAVVSKTRPIPQTFSEDEHAEDIVSDDPVAGSATVADFFSKPSDAAHADDGSDDAEGLPPALADHAAEDRLFPAGPEESGPADDAFGTAAADASADDEVSEAEAFARDVADNAEEAEAHPVLEADAAEEPRIDVEPDAAAEVDEDEDTDLAAVLARIEAEFEPEATLDFAETATLPDDETEDTAQDYDFSAFFAEEGAAPATAATAGDDAPVEAPLVRARVIRVKRSELRAALDAGMLREDRFAGADAIDEDADWSREADLTDEDELDRLMSEADGKMNEAEGTDRRAAFDHMRGAVAATLDDEELETEDSADDAEYRTDFAAAVTPRRPVAGARTDRPRDQRPAPLKLVAEQRVDVPAVKSGPVQPRRVAAADAKPTEEDRGFAEYAAARGAHDLPDLLEAAASYLSFVEGRDQFSRPQLMTKVRQLDPEGFNREDGLRHFGKLLRSGKIEKIKGGRFTVSDEIGFRPDGERAAG